MIRLRFQPEDLAEIRFAFSPLVELVMSLRVLGDSARHALHRPWVQRAQRRLQGLGLDPLRALVPARSGYIPDFVAPPPQAPVTEFESALEALRRTDPEVIRREVEKVVRDRPETASVLDPLAERPSESTDELGSVMAEYWERALADHWSELLSVLEGEVLWRARRLAIGGPAGLFADLHRQVEYGDSTLTVHKAHEEDVVLSGRGLLLVPSVFAWPDVFVVTDRPWRPTLWYPARGIGWLWDASVPAVDRTLERLVGETRGQVLQCLRAPSTTGELARRLDLSPSTVSQHLSRLYETGLLGKTRVGRRVFYGITPTGRRLLELLGGSDTAEAHS